MRKCRKMIGNLEEKILVFTTIILLVGSLTVMTNAASQNDNGFHKLIGIEETLKKPLNQNRRVKRNFGLFCRNIHISKCKEYYSQILEIGNMGNQIDEEPLKRYGIGKVDSLRREKLNNMLLKIRSWQQNKLMELQLCFECEKHIRSYKVNMAPYISSNFYDIPIPVPLNFRPNQQDLFYH